MRTNVLLRAIFLTGCGLATLLPPAHTLALVRPQEFAPLTVAVQQQQAQAAETSLKDVLDQASRLSVKGQFEQSRVLAEAALVRARVEKDQHSEGSALLILGSVAQNAGEYAKARSLYDQGLTIFEQRGEQDWIARALFDLAAVAYLEGKHEEANERAKKALAGFEAAGDLQGKAKILQFQGGHSQEVVELARRIGDKYLEASALHSWGDALFAKGDFGGAEEKTEQAGELYQQLGAQNDYARVLISLGRIQRAHGRARDAIPFYQRAMEIQKKTGDKLGQVQSLNAIGVSYGFLQEGRTAKQYHIEALALAEQTGSARTIDFIQGALASDAIALGDFDGAEAALKAIIARGADENPDSRYSALSRVYLAKQQYEEALAAANKSVELARQLRTERVPLFLTGRADVERHLNQVRQAQADLKDALDMVEEQRRHLVSTDFMKRGFISGYYQRIFSAAIGLHEQTGEVEKALEVAESARARGFIDLLATRAVQLKEKDKSAIAEFRKAERELPAASPDPGATSSDELFGLTFRGDSRRLAKPLQKLRSSDPGLLSFVSAEPPKREEILSTAKRLRSTLLCYWTSEEEAYVWIVSPSGGIKSKRIDAREARLAELVRATTFIAGSGTKGPDEKLLAARGGTVALPRNGDAPWRALYALLIAPVRADLPTAPGSRLTIIPHGPLTGLSFAGLVSPRNRYLVEDYEIHYAPSVSLLVLAGNKAPRTSEVEKKYLLVADPVLQPLARGETALPRLPAAQDEVRAIAKHLPESDSTLMVGVDATESAFRLAARDKSVLHLATHAIVNPGEPLDSYLLLSGDGTSPSNDGRLTAEEIYGLDLNADLVVLSACRTGSANGSVGGEGIAHLARAFFYAGSSSMMVTLWDVEDTASSRLITHFYQRWPAKENKSAALRNAQLSLIKELRAGKIRAQTPAGPLTLPEHPFFWAGFVLLGEP